MVRAVQADRALGVPAVAGQVAAVVFSVVEVEAVSVQHLTALIARS